MEKHRFIYKTTHLPTGRYYIGMHETSNLDDGYLGSGVVLTRRIKKHPKEEFEREILAFCKTREELCSAEKEAIAPYLDDPQNINIQAGGFGGGDIAQDILAWKQKDFERYLRIKARQAQGRKQGTARCQTLREEDPQWRANELAKIRTSCKLGCLAANTLEAQVKRQETFEKIKHQQGKKNSQFGKMWITNGIESTRIMKDEEIPEGWRRGRVIKSTGQFFQ